MLDKRKDKRITDFAWCRANRDPLAEAHRQYSNPVLQVPFVNSCSVSFVFTFLTTCSESKQTMSEIGEPKAVPDTNTSVSVTSVSISSHLEDETGVSSFLIPPPLEEGSPYAEEAFKILMLGEDSSTALSLNRPLPLVGREDELKRMLHAYERVLINCNQHLEKDRGAKPQPEVTRNAVFMFVHGDPGTGKSALVEEFRKRVLHETNQEHDLQKRILFVTGNSNEDSGSTSTDPFSTIIFVIEEICSHLLQQTDKELKKLKASLNQAMAGEGQLLVNMVPLLEEIVGPQPKPSESATSLLALNRFKVVLQNFLRIVCRPEYPIVFFIDDMQWVDSASMDLFSLLTLEKINHFMFIGAYRTHEIHNDHPLLDTIANIKQKGNSLLYVNLEPLDTDEAQQLVAEILNNSGQDVQQITSVLYQKTKGNPFHTIGAIDVMKHKGVVFYNSESKEWKCDIRKLEVEMEDAGNVVALLSSRLSSCAMDLQKVLHVAAFLPQTFELHLLASVLETIGSTVPLEDLSRLLDDAVVRGVLMNQMGSSSYSFKDKRIQRAAMQTICENERNIMALKIGRSFTDLYRKKGDSWMLFLAADHLNSIPFDMISAESDEKAIPDMVWTNIMAGEKSVRIAAFGPASIYFRQAVRVIEQDAMRWTNQYRTCVKLYSLAADVEFTIGSFERAHKYANEVLLNASDLSDKLPAYLAMSHGYGQRERHSDALHIGIKCLKALNQMPKGPFPVRAVYELGMSKKKLGKMQDQDFLMLPRCLLPEKILAMTVLINVSKNAFFCGEKFLSICSTLKAIKLSLTHGLCPASAMAFSNYAGRLCAIFNDQNYGKRMNAIAHQIAQMVDAKEYESQILFNTASYVNSWIEPIPRALDTFNQAYKAGCEAGDLTMGLLSLTAYNVYSLAAGLPLGPIVDDCRHIKCMIRIYDISSIESMFDSFCRLVVDLTEEGGHLSSLDERLDPPVGKKPDTSLTYRLIWLYLTRMMAAYFFGKYEAAEKASAALDKYAELDPSFATTTWALTFGSLIATARYRETKKAKYKKAAQVKIAGIKNLLKFRGLNVLHKYFLVEVDFASTFPTKKKGKEIQEDFDKAIGSAARSGYLQDAGIASELAGEYFIRNQDLFWAKHYFSNAYRSYESWGAAAKVKQLLHNRGSFIEKDSLGSGKMRASRSARVEMTQEIVEMHRTLDPSREVPKTLSSSDVLSKLSSASFMASDAFSNEFKPPPQEPRKSSAGDGESLHSLLSDSSVSTMSRSVVSKHSNSKAKARIEFASREIAKIRAAAAKTQRGKSIISSGTGQTLPTMESSSSIPESNDEQKNPGVPVISETSQ